MAMIGLLLGYLVLLPAILANTKVHNGVYKLLDRQDKGAFLVTFKSADLRLASKPEALLEIAMQAKRVLVQSVDDFVSSQEYSNERGQYVYEQIKQHHRETKGMLRELIPNVRIISSIPISNSFVIYGGREEVLNLERCKEVVEIHSNEPFKIDLPYERIDRAMPDRMAVRGPGRLMRTLRAKGDEEEEPKGQPQWNIVKIGADKVWKRAGRRTRGQGVVYAIADTGVSYQHPNIRNNYLGLRASGNYDHNYAWYDGVRRQIASDSRATCGFASPAPCDDQGHGTHVTSTAVGADGYGVAPGARWMACRNMDRGVGSPESYLNCLNFFLAPHDLNGLNPRPDLRPHVIGNSYGCPDAEGCSKHAMTTAVEALRAAGIFMSVSAGNEGPGCSTIADPPALERAVISVGATDSNDNLAPFSSRGPVFIDGQSYRKPDVSAPGVRILAAYPPDNYRHLSGTSMASPHVGGAAALITAMCPHLERNVDQLQMLLQATALPLKPPTTSQGAPLCGNDRPDSVPNNYFGYGRIDVEMAVKKCLEMLHQPQCC